MRKMDEATDKWMGNQQPRPCRPPPSTLESYLLPDFRQPPPTRKRPALRRKVQALKREARTTPFFTRENLKKGERGALKGLIHNPNIVANKADKSPSIVIMSTENYRAAGMKHLKDERTYEPITDGRAALEQAQERDKKLILDLYRNEGRAGTMTVALRDSFLKHKSRVPSIYFLPKTHKDLDPTTGTWKTRPVVSGCAAPTRPVDKFLTALLMPLVELLPNRIKDTTHFLQKMEALKDELQEIPEDYRLVSLDIESLYPSIPQKEAAARVSSFYGDRLPDIKDVLRNRGIRTPPSQALIRKAILHVMQDTLLEFDRRTYRQKTGTAIGASVSVAIAELFVYLTVEVRLKRANLNLLVFCRSIEDIICIIPGAEPEVQRTLTWLNGVNRALRFTFEMEEKELPFLNTKVYLDAKCCLQTKTYYKPSHTHQFLLWTSAHPTSLRRSLPYSMALRIKRICSETTECSYNIGHLRVPG
ncbi:hypothetical protein OTU49_002677 [Cherax quadricarinatus]|uniref:Helix-turn-helix domain-containing protein n=1 Tax=Cherax quadricarinatus TaxID=27406 RepID=A0AAW0XMQ0_CHEQU|nr:uncharacterized protein LOC128690323 isoform X3 [Cherax quadricarinatus]XP_053634975.1 uncharacterized protein LOC128690323 isoform X3 [Cherax quadricarinatus]XP_053634976.1 uncharacterized protein LOC128690323 isoform X3 [Cherax quadricarinatus]XP_053634977.1 uncharacterized protein LOC128690323 isoform X3 [Cherax quadricarinatus]